MELNRNDEFAFFLKYHRMKDKEHISGTIPDPDPEIPVLYETNDGVEQIAIREWRTDARRTREWYDIGSL